MSRIRALIATAVDLTKCCLCNAPAVTTTRPLIGQQVGLCATHANRKG